MTSHNFLKFNKIYDDTYNKVVKYVVCRCNNIEDVNDIVQDIYVEFYKRILKDDIDNYESYLIGIARNKINKYYNILYKIKNISIFASKDKEINLINMISDNMDIENIILDKIDIDLAWNYLKKKNKNIQIIFYLYYNLDFTIKDISKELNLGQSYIKNCLYRTLKELKVFFKEDSKYE